MFYIIKKGSGNFWHRYNSNTKEVNLSNWQIVLDLVAQSVCLELLNGSNVPKNAVSILDVIVIDETDASTEETFTDVETLRLRLIALGYNPYITADGGATYIEAGTNITITGTGTLSDPYVINSTGGAGSLTWQDVVDNGAVATIGGNTINFEDTDLGGGISIKKVSGDKSTVFYLEEQLFSILQSDSGTGKNASYQINSQELLSFQSNSDGTKSTQNVVDTPTNNTIWHVPAKTVDGDYNYASEDYVDDGLDLKEDLSNKVTDLSSNDNTHYPTTQAVQSAINTAVTGLLDYRGSFDASTNLFPATGGSGIAGAVLKGDFWICSVAGALGGVPVTPGDLIIALIDAPAQTSANWDLISNELGYTPEDVANKTDTMAGNTASSTKYLSAKGVYDWATSVFQTLASFASDVRATVLTGFSAAAGTVSSSDSILSAFNKIVGNITANTNEIATAVKVKFRSGTSSSAWTGAITEHEMLAITLPIGTFTTTDFLKIRLQLNKTTGLSTALWRIKISTSATMPAGNTDRVATFTDAAGARTYPIIRSFWQSGGNLVGTDFTASNMTDFGTVVGGLSTQAFNNSTTQYYLYVSVTLTNAGDSISLSSYEITN